MISLSQAKLALEKSEQKAKELGVAVTTTLVDASGNVIATSRMDGAINISPKFAYTKARTSSALGMPTSALGEYAKPGSPYYGLNDIFGGELTTISGGIPVKINNKVVGAVGVGGSTDVSQDEMCAQAAVSSFIEK